MNKNIVQELLKESMELHQKGEVLNAIKKYSEVIELEPTNHDALHLIGVALHQIGNDDEAIEYINKSFKSNNKNGFAYNNLGTIYSKKQEYTIAIINFDKAIILNSKHSEAYFNKANALKNLDENNTVEIEKFYKLAIKYNLKNKLAYNNLAVFYYENKKYEESIYNCNKAISIDPNYHEAYNNRGNSRRSINKYPEAELDYKKALEINPNYSNAYLNLAVLYRDEKKYELGLEFALKAINNAENKNKIYKLLGELNHQLKNYNQSLNYFNNALIGNKSDAEIYNNIGVTYSSLSQLLDALLSFEKAISLDACYAVAYFNKGNTLVSMRRFNEALNSYESAIKNDSNREDFYNNKGTTLVELKKFPEAIPIFEKSLTINSKNGAPYYNIGNCYFEAKEYKNAEINYTKAIDLGLKVDFSGGLPCHMRAQMCDWSQYDDDKEIIIKSNLSNEKYGTPFLISFLIDDLKTLQVTSELMSEKYVPIDNAPPTFSKLNNKKIKIGYFSSDFKNHPVSFLLIEHLQLHNRNEFEILAISYSMGIKDDMSTRIQNSVDEFIDVSNFSDFEIVDICRNKKIDIAIDLNGYTSGNRTAIFANRVAPIQISYLGFLGTLGAKYFDYIIADDILIPVESRKYYNEKIIYLDVYQVNDRNRIISDKQLKRIDFGLTDEQFVFCCFNNNYKINPETYSLWMEILLKTSNSILFLYEENKFTKNNLLTEASKYGVSKERIIFAEKIPLNEHLYRYSVCNLFLDTSPYNAGTTASDALWCGLPVLTRIGNTLSARMAASILQAHDLPELIVNNNEEYVEMAIKLCNDLDYYKKIKSKTKQKANSKLFNSPAFTKSFELAMKMAIDNFNNNVNDNIHVNDEFYKEKNINMEKDLKVLNFDNPIFWGTREPEAFVDIIKAASKLTGAYHFADNLFVFGRSLSMLRDDKFMSSWSNNIVSPSDGAIIWRRFILAMAAYHCQHLEGDFVECGAYEGVGAKTVLDYLGGPIFNKNFWLYDIFLHSDDMENHKMPKHGPNLYDEVANRFFNYPNVKIIKGLIPESFANGCPDKISYLHIDLNQVTAEIACLDYLFEKVVPGGIIIFDDYEMYGYHKQKIAEDEWLSAKGYKVFALPTCQGLVLKR